MITGGMRDELLSRWDDSRDVTGRSDGMVMLGDGYYLAADDESDSDDWAVYRHDDSGQPRHIGSVADLVDRDNQLEIYLDCGSTVMLTLRVEVSA